MTRGISSPRTYYYRRLLTEAVRAVDAVRRLDRVDPDRVAVIGQSQGGGTALAVPDLAPRLLRRTAGRVTSESLRTGSAPSCRTRRSAFRTDADETR
ncbi:acetylxylan esterase [Streptomyces sp. NPDC001315]|uniref:acetylxylan esterase n=1 Tax=Streptomyces sp. NPDC001315 TaxID=3364562 RepID=UPI00369D9A25